MAHVVFISYVEEDRLTAVEICNMLDEENVSCWIAPRDVDPGVKWATAILDAIASSRILILVFSEDANRSDHVEREIAEASDNKTIIIPFRIKNTQPTGTLKYYLSGVQWLDAVKPPLARHLDSLVVRAKRLLSGPRQN